MILEQIEESLNLLGFERVLEKPTYVYGRYVGYLKTDNNSFLSEIDIVDKDFIKPPKIRLIEKSKKIDGFRAHLGFNNSLCYLDADGLVLDRYNVSDNIKFCIKEAEKVLEKIIKNKVQEDIPQEFFIYWDGLECLADIDRINSENASLYALRSENNKVILFVLTDKIERLLEKIKAIKHINPKFITTFRMPILSLKSNNRPNINQKKWPPEKLGEFIDWLREYDDFIFKKLCHKLQDINFLNSIGFGLIIQTPDCMFGISILFDNIINGLIKVQFKKYSDLLEKRFERFVNLDYLLYHDMYRHFVKDSLISGKGRGNTVYRFRLNPFDEHFIHRRNTPNNGLIEKKILIIGCGTIGGFIASFLAKQGVGATKKSKLTLVDNDYLDSANIGRHYLGTKYLFRNKAIGTKKQILEDFPNYNIESFGLDIRNINFPWDVDLIIDATGEEPLSEWLNDTIVKKNKEKNNSPPVLFTWIVGPNLAVQSFYYDGIKACYHCLKVPNGDGSYSQRYKVVEDQDQDWLVTDSCSKQFIPFPVSASTMAASLNVDMVNQWCEYGKPHKFLRTIRLDLKKTIPIDDNTPERFEYCQACGRGILKG